MEEALTHLLDYGSLGVVVVVSFYYIFQKEKAHAKEREAFNETMKKNQEQLLDSINKSNQTDKEQSVMLGELKAKMDILLSKR